MVTGGARLVLGGVRFTPSEVGRIRELQLQGFNRQAIRAAVREEFGRGLPNNAFAALRQAERASGEAGRGLARGQRGRSIAQTRIPTIEVEGAPGGYQLTAQLRYVTASGYRGGRTLARSFERPPTRRELEELAETEIADVRSRYPVVELASGLPYEVSDVVLLRYAERPPR